MCQSTNQWEWHILQQKKIIIIMQGMVDTQGVTKECSLVALLGKLVNGVHESQ